MDRTAAMFYYYDALVQFCLDSKILAFKTRWPRVAIKETDAGHLPLAVVWRQIQLALNMDLTESGAKLHKDSTKSGA